MSRICVLLLLSPVIGLVFAADDDEENQLPSTAQRLVDRHDHELAELRERYLADVADLREDVTRDLERELKKVTRRGDLEGALAIKEKIEQLKEQEEAIAETPTDFLGNDRSPIARLLGKWRVERGFYKYVFEIKEDGTFEHSRQGTQEWVVNDEGKIKWVPPSSPEAPCLFEERENGWVLTQEATGKVWTMTRIEEDE